MLGPLCTARSSSERNTCIYTRCSSCRTTWRTSSPWLLISSLIELRLNEAAQLFVNKVSILQNLLPCPYAFALVRYSFSPDVHRCLELFQPLVTDKIASLSYHTTATLTAFNYLLEHNETFKLSSIHVVWKLRLPLLVSQLDNLLKHLVKSLALLLLDYQEDVIELVFYGARSLES